jgi:Holliday junction resolvase
MGGKSPRQKGDRDERQLVKLLQLAGFAATRMPLSGGGSRNTRYTGFDVTVPLLGADRRVEVKVRGNGFVELYRWLERVDLLVVRADRREPLVVVPLRLAIEIASAAERKRNG